MGHRLDMPMRELYAQAPMDRHLKGSKVVFVPGFLEKKEQCTVGKDYNAGITAKAFRGPSTKAGQLG